MNFPSADHEIFNLLACLIIWEIWKSRNSCQHEGNKFPAAKICDRVLFSIRSISEAKPFSAISAPIKRILHLHVKHNQPRLCRSISWFPPAVNRVKLNVDGSSMGNLGHSGGGAIIQNHLGIPLFGFSSYYGSLTSLSAECRALRDGVQLCLQQGFSSVEVEMDSLLLCQMITGSSNVAWQLDNEIRQIKQSTAGLNFSFSHIFREANAAANSLASQASSSHLTYTFDRISIPYVIKGTVALDAIKFPYTRHR